MPGTAAQSRVSYQHERGSSERRADEIIESVVSHELLLYQHPQHLETRLEQCASTRLCMSQHTHCFEQ
jgi:hypothetical protein